MSRRFARMAYLLENLSSLPVSNRSTVLIKLPGTSRDNKNAATGYRSRREEAPSICFGTVWMDC
jgi:hypothetical protein